MGEIPAVGQLHLCRHVPNGDAYHCAIGNIFKHARKLKPKRKISTSQRYTPSDHRRGPQVYELLHCIRVVSLYAGKPHVRFCAEMLIEEPPAMRGRWNRPLLASLKSTKAAGHHNGHLAAKSHAQSFERPIGCELRKLHRLPKAFHPSFMVEPSV